MITTDRLYRFGVLAAVCGALLSGCLSPVEPPPDVVLFGVWEWVRAEGGIAGVTFTPETEGFTWQLRIIRPDRIRNFHEREEGSAPSRAGAALGGIR